MIVVRYRWTRLRREGTMMIIDDLAERYPAARHIAICVAGVPEAGRVRNA